jgi:galactokinase
MSISSQGNGSGAFLQPFLKALAKVRDRDTLQLDDLEKRARKQLTERFGVSDLPVSTASAPGHVALLAEHTYYFDGFGLLLPIPYGTAVALRRAKPEDASCFFEGDETILSLTTSPEHDEFSSSEISSPNPGKELLAATLREIPVQVSVVSTIPTCCTDGFVASLVVAAARAVARLQPEKAAEPDIIKLARTVESVVKRAFSVAPVLAALNAEAGQALLVDTHTGGSIGIDLPEPDQFLFGLVDVGVSTTCKPSVYGERKAKAAEALTRMNIPGMGAIDSYRDLEHRHLVAALGQIPRGLQPVARFLVAENRRVQRAVTALRKGDMQLVGGHMFMSQAALRNDWAEHHAGIEQLRERAESTEAVHGIRRTGREFGSVALVAGQTLAVVQFLEEIAGEELPAGKVVETMLL